MSLLPVAGKSTQAVRSEEDKVIQDKTKTSEVCNSQARHAVS